MTLRIDTPKWILYRHTKSLDIILAVADYLKNYNRASISEEEKTKNLLRLKDLGLYKGRNNEMPLDSINHRINTLAYYMFGYKSKIAGEEKFLFSPLGNLFLSHQDNKLSRSKIFLTMLWAVQFEHPHGGTDSSFKIYPFRLVFKLLTDDRLQRRIYAYEMAYLIVFEKEINDEKYENLIRRMIKMRSDSDEEIAAKFKKNEHAYVNSAYEWDYYVSEFFVTAGVLEKTEGTVICKLQHGKTNTFRKVTRNFVTINPNVYRYCVKLLTEYPYDNKPLKLNDVERMTSDIVKEIYSFYPQILLKEIGEHNKDLEKVLNLPKLIEQYSNNNEGTEAYLFEDILTDGFNMFYNVEAKKIGGAGNADIECLYLERKKKFSVDAKSTKNKLSGLNAGRLESHRDKIGADYTIVITPRYVPAVKSDIKSSRIVIILASTFSEYLYNNISNNVRDIDYGEIDNIIISNFGIDISPAISNLTFSKFGIGNK